MGEGPGVWGRWGGSGHTGLELKGGVVQGRGRKGMLESEYIQH